MFNDNSVYDSLLENSIATGNWTDFEYLKLVDDVLTNGELKPTRAKIDGRNVSAYSVFGRQLRFNLQDGFPLLTTKKVSFNNICHELLWMLKGDTNTKYLEDNNVTIWREWQDEDGDLGPVYGKQFRRIETMQWVKPLIIEEPEYVHFTPFNKDIQLDYSSNKCNFIGKVVNTRTGPCTVLKEIPPTEDFIHSKFIVKFHNTGYEVETEYGHIQKATIKDKWAQTVFGVGYYGDYDNTDSYYEILVNVWRDMLRRCYYKKSKAYKYYGGKGVWVSHDWWCFANFQKDVKELYNWSMKKEWPEDYSLDKDILSAANFYSKNTCRWSSLEEQQLNSNTNTPFSAISHDGKKHLFPTLGYMARKYNMNIGAIFRCLKGELKTHHNWQDFKYVYNDGKMLKTKITDQLKLSLSMLKHDRNSRRNIITLWNPPDIENMALPPCHGNIIQFYIQNNTLSLHMYQRSIDLFLGCSYNIASYSLLTHIMAKLSGLQVGEFIYSMGDVHIYQNLVNQCKEQMRRNPYKLPLLKIAEGVEDIDSLKREDFCLTDYKSHGVLKGEVAI